MVSVNIIKKKINAIQFNLGRISKYTSLSLEEFSKGDDVKDIVAHNLFLALQNMIDIGTHIIADANWDEPNFLSEIPEILAKERVIAVESVKPLKAMIGLRNLIAHEYGDLDFTIIYRIVQEDLGDLNRFLEAVIKYCKL